MGKLDDKVILITGANQGIGKGMAKLFASEGAKLAIGARNAEKLQAVADELTAAGTEVVSQPTDVTDLEQVQSLFAATMERFGRIDILVNNAGAFDGGRIDEVTTEGWNNVIGVCLTGAFYCTREAFTIMKEQGGGRILNIGSISAQVPRPGSGPYVAAKFGIWGLTKATTLDGREFGIIASCLHPGNVAIERRQESDKESDQEPMMDIETIAEAGLAMVSLPDHVNFLEGIVLPRDQVYIGRG
ncbi:MAG: SDR family oxidoreductase [Planctomycetota bacterium]|jgi:NAD(P)-dependent dehydrogenase (short-subunit alcohol dehydrogenase family)|nr:SDR family oxidoreductase [Planctomycetota bacterium]